MMECKSIGCSALTDPDSTSDFCSDCGRELARNEFAMACEDPRLSSTLDVTQVSYGRIQNGNGDANGEGKQTNPKDVIGARKAKFSVIPAGVLFDIGNAMTEGMVKYGRHNYRYAGVRSSIYYDASMGHLADWWEGQDLDPESGLSHVTKALASLVVLRDAMMQGMLTDDRPPRSKVFKADFSGMTAQIIDRHADKNPRHFTIEDSE